MVLKRSMYIIGSMMNGETAGNTVTCFRLRNVHTRVVCTMSSTKKRKKEELLIQLSALATCVVGQ